MDFITGQNERGETTQNTTVTKKKKLRKKFISGQNEREETTQDTIVTKSAACASYEINYLTYITKVIFITGQNRKVKQASDFDDIISSKQL